MQPTLRLLASSAIALYLALLLAAFPIATALSLPKLGRFRRKCYTSLPMCIMQSNNVSSRGCGQCDTDVREAPLREVRTESELTQVRLQGGRAIILIPERVFFSKKVRSSISFWTNIDALIVYGGPPKRPNEFVDNGAANQTIDLLFNYSLDETEPNRLYNFYPDGVGSDNRCDGNIPRRNNPGDCTFQQFIPFNIFYINASLSDQILRSAARFGDPNFVPDGNERGAFSPQFKLQSTGRMWACATTMTPTPTTTISIDNTVSGQNAGSAVTSEQCLRDKTCLPIGGHSLWSALGRVNSRVPAAQRKYLFITAPMDSFAFFPEFGMGAGAEIASLAVLMAVADRVAIYWREQHDEGDFERQPVYFALNAQSWGYAGSSRFLRDMLEFECTNEADFAKGERGCTEPSIDNLKFKDFKDADIQVLNLGQLITPATTMDGPSDPQFFIHHEDGTSNTLGDEFKKSFGQFDLNLERGGFDYESNVPLTPIDATQSFKFFNGSKDMDVVSISNYAVNFSTEIYHSSLDTELRISHDGQRIPMYRAAHAIASAVIGIAFGVEGRWEVNTTIVDNVITCMTGNWTDCSMAQDYLGKESENATVQPGNYPGPFFPISVLKDHKPSGAAKLALIRAFFAHHDRFNESTVTCESENDCAVYNRDINEKASPKSQSELFDAQCTRGRCVVSDTHTHRAFGGGINMIDKKGGFELESKYERESFDGNLPRQGDWTESFWDPDTGFCEQVQDSLAYEAVIFGVGLCVLVLSFGFGIWLDYALFEDKVLDAEDESSISNIGDSLVPFV